MLTIFLIGVSLASVRIKNLTNTTAAIKKKFLEIKQDQGLLLEIAEVSIENFQGFARSGKNPSTGQMFPKLSKGWVGYRHHLLKTNKESSFFLGADSTKSNLTFTGNLLNSIKAKIDSSKGRVSFYAKGTHPGYGDGKPKQSNQEIVDDLATRGFEFMVVGEKLKKRINVLVKRFIRKTLTR